MVDTRARNEGENDESRCRVDHAFPEWEERPGFGLFRIQVSAPACIPILYRRMMGERIMEEKVSQKNGNTCLEHQEFCAFKTLSAAVRVFKKGPFLLVFDEINNILRLMGF